MNMAQYHMIHKKLILHGCALRFMVSIMSALRNKLSSFHVKKSLFLVRNDLKNKKLIKPNNKLLYSASCHNISDINIANKHNFDFILLSPVLASKSNINTLGWDSFKRLSLEANMPVFALGGMKKSDLDHCLSNNGHGVSGITNF